jgi:hypothetical protein
MRIPVRIQFRSLWYLLIAWFVSIHLPQAAQAALITVTVTGTVSSGIDVTGVFGPADTNLTGQNFTLVMTFDDTLGTESLPQNNGIPPCGSENMGTTPATGSSGLSPGTGAVLTIGGGTYVFGMFPVSSSVSSFVYRNVDPGNNGDSYFGFSFGYTYNNYYYDAAVMQVSPAPGTPPFGGTCYWSSPFTDSQIVGTTSFQVFYISAAGVRYSANANLIANSITVSGGGSTTPSESAKSQGSTGDTPGACPCGDPISVGTGNLFEQVSDYQTAGSNQLGFSR